MTPFSLFSSQLQRLSPARFVKSKTSSLLEATSHSSHFPSRKFRLEDRARDRSSRLLRPWTAASAMMSQLCRARPLSSTIKMESTSSTITITVPMDQLDTHRPAVCKNSCSLFSSMTKMLKRVPNYEFTSSPCFELKFVANLGNPVHCTTPTVNS